MRRVAVRAIIEKDGKLLLVRLRQYNGGPENDFYCTVGGGLDEGESLIDGIKREVVEETGVSAEIGKLLCIQQFKDKHDHIEFFFHVTNASDFENIDLRTTTHGAIEIGEIAFYEPRNIYVLPRFLSEVDVHQLLSSPSPIMFNYL